MGIRAMLGNVQRWFTGNNHKLVRLHEDVISESEAVSQEAKALSNQLRYVAKDDDMWDIILADMKAVRKARKHHA